MRPLNHQGRFFKVRGPINMARCPQGHPVIIQAGGSPSGLELAARTADVVFSVVQELAPAKAAYADLKGRMAKYGRAPDEIAVLPGVMPIVGDSDAEATPSQVHNIAGGSTASATAGRPSVEQVDDPPERDAMQRPPRPPRQGILDPIRGRLLVGGVATGLAAFASFLIGESDSHATGQTMAFATLVFAQLAYAFAVRGADWFFRVGRNIRPCLALWRSPRSCRSRSGRNRPSLRASTWSRSPLPGGLGAGPRAGPLPRR